MTDATAETQTCPFCYTEMDARADVCPSCQATKDTTPEWAMRLDFYKMGAPKDGKQWIDASRFPEIMRK